MENIWIYGAGGLGRETANWISQVKGVKFAGFIDIRNGNKSFPDQSDQMVIAIADCELRMRLYEKFRINVSENAFIHPRAQLDELIKAGAGTLICRGVEGTVNLRIGISCIINLNCTLGHDSVLSDFCTLMPGVHVSGNVFVGEGSLIGAGAVILPGIRIGKGCKIGAGAVVTKDVPDFSVSVGIPAAIVKSLKVYE